MSDTKQATQSIVALKSAISAVPSTPNPDLSKVKTAFTAVQAAVNGLPTTSDLTAVKGNLAVLASEINALNPTKPVFSAVNSAIDDLTTAVNAL